MLPKVRQLIVHVDVCIRKSLPQIRHLVPVTNRQTEEKNDCSLFSLTFPLHKHETLSKVRLLIVRPNDKMIVNFFYFSFAQA